MERARAVGVSIESLEMVLQIDYPKFIKGGGDELFNHSIERGRF